MSSEALERDWSSLPSEILNLVAKRLSEIHDFVRFRAVCKAWRSSAPIADLPPQFPWILEERKDSSEPDLSFYSIRSRKFYTINSPISLNKMLTGPSDGYLLARSDHYRPISLLNPLNNHELPLPAHDWYGSSDWLGPMQNQMGDYVVFYEFSGHESPKLAFCHPGQDNSWCAYYLDSSCKYYHCLYLNGELFSVKEATGVTEVMVSMVYVIPPVDGIPARRFEFLVEASGDILRIIKYANSKYWSYSKFDVYQLNVNGSGSPCWVKVNNIGNHALFVYRCGVLVLRANDNAGIRSNCIYHLKYIDDGHPQGPIKGIELIDIKTDAREHLRFPLFQEPACWFVPSLHRFHTQ